VRGLKPLVRPGGKAKPKLVPGDVVAVPSATGGHHLIVFIRTDSAGPWFGIVRGKYPLRPPQFERPPEIVKPLFYTHAEPIRTGRWIVVGQAPELLRLFPPKPEIYYANDAFHKKLKLDIGPHGSAADPDTLQMRHISEQEAREVGLMDGTYRASYLGKLLEKHLDAVAGD
jgi:hypothetical protein